MGTRRLARAHLVAAALAAEHGRRPARSPRAGSPSSTGAGTWPGQRTGPTRRFRPATRSRTRAAPPRRTGRGDRPRPGATSDRAVHLLAVRHGARRRRRAERAVRAGRSPRCPARPARAAAAPVVPRQAARRSCRRRTTARRQAPRPSGSGTPTAPASSARVLVGADRPGRGVHPAGLPRRRHDGPRRRIAPGSARRRHSSRWPARSPSWPTRRAPCSTPRPPSAPCSATSPTTSCPRTCGRSSTPTTSPAARAGYRAVVDGDGPRNDHPAHPGGRRRLALGELVAVEPARRRTRRRRLRGTRHHRRGRGRRGPAGVRRHVPRHRRHVGGRHLGRERDGRRPCTRTRAWPPSSACRWNRPTTST